MRIMSGILFATAVMLSVVAAAGDMETLRQRMVKAVLSNPGASDEAIKKILSNLKADGSFADVDYKAQNRSGWDSAKHIANIRILALAWARRGGKYYHDQNVGDAIRRGMIYWGTLKLKADNWWWNDIGIPTHCADIMMLASELFTDPAEREIAMFPMKRVSFGMTGQNRTWKAQLVFQRALLENNPDDLRKAAAEIYDEVKISEAEGINRDGCFHQHGPQIQFGNYGLSFLATTTGFGSRVAGTGLAMSPGQIKILSDLVLNGFDWILWRGSMDLQAQGRQFGRDSQRKKAGSVLGSIRRLSTIDPARKKQYDAILKRNASSKAVNTLVGTKFFWNSDLLVVREPEYYVSVRMTSTRTRPIEDGVNADNMLGRYFSDGARLVMLDGTEYKDVLPCWNWTRIPGTTLPATPRYTRAQLGKEKIKIYAPFTYSKKRRNRGDCDFVGAATAGRLAAAVYTQKIDGVRAKKAYFAAPGVIVELGCDINSTSPFPVATTVEQCRLQGDVVFGSNYVWHNNIAYVGDQLRGTSGHVKGDWRNVLGSLSAPKPAASDIFTVAIEHGAKCRNAAYQVIILPGVPRQRATAPLPAKILSNTPKLQAVKFSDGGAVAAVFHQPGTLGDFSTSKPGVFIIDGDTVYAADPTHKLTGIELKLDGETQAVVLPEKPLAGSTIAVKFQNRRQP